MPCFFCKQSTHVSEYCRDFPTLRSRYSYLSKHKQSKCLCPKYEPLFLSKENPICKCKTICEVCFQHHHIAMCPKRDIDHPSNPIIFPESLSLFSHHSPFAIRFFELCNPAVQFKLQKSCKFFKSLHPPNLKLKPDFEAENPTEPNNVVMNRCGKFLDVHNIKDSMLDKNCFFNFAGIWLEKSFITKADLQILSKSDPYVLLIKNCTLEHSLSLHDILEAFPYAYDITYISEETQENWVLSFLCVDRKVGLKKVTLRDDILSCDANDLVMLFEQNEELNLIVFVESTFKTTTREELQAHPRFSARKPDQDCDLCITLDNGIKYCFRFVRF